MGLSMRCFISLPVSNEAMAEALEIQAKITKENPNLVIRWSEANNFHLTMKFLGEITEDDAVLVKKILSQVSARQFAVPCVFKELSAFPDSNHANTVIVKIETERVRDLLADIEASLVSNGFVFENEKPWQAHLTLGRLKEPLVLSGLQKIVVKPITWMADKIEFFKSDLSPRGSKFTKMGEWPLK